ncbi:6-bladed beta-propeller [Pedobacter sp. SYP-B3415]|uniref:6-bladed beta-propeller n=1 Tax=Pedobacter sp. SYP-B3415 TaxID=2496641 RepID=UPI00101C86C1|nr:6-bladed beta-propeller [Pedobacter sp. SYP-B3415]
MKTIYILFFAVALVSCGRSSRTNINTIQTEKGDVKQFTIDADEVFEIEKVLEEPTFVKLETKPECLIGTIDKLICTDSLIVVVDRRVAQAVFVFDSAGRFLGKIAEKGKGPGEFTEIWDVNINEESRHIELLDEKLKKINKYTYECRYVDYKRMPFIFTGYQPLDSSTFAYYTNKSPNARQPIINNNLLVTAKSNNKILGKAFPLTQNEKNNSMSFETFNAPLWKYGKSVFFNPRFSDTIFRVTPNKLFAEYIVKMRGMISSANWEKMDNERFQKLLETHSYLNGTFIDLQDHSYVNVTTPKGRVHGFYLKSSGKVISGRSFSTINPFYNFFEIPLAAKSNNSFVVVQTAQQILDAKALINMSIKTKSPKIQEELKVFSKLSKDDNPILVFFKAKKV